MVGYEPELAERILRTLNNRYPQAMSLAALLDCLGVGAVVAAFSPKVYSIRGRDLRETLKSKTGTATKCRCGRRPGWKSSDLPAGGSGPRHSSKSGCIRR
jgi:hypothetical protein